jgi:hypothetical protein
VFAVEGKIASFMKIDINRAIEEIKARSEQPVMSNEKK